MYNFSVILSQSSQVIRILINSDQQDRTSKLVAQSGYNIHSDSVNFSKAFKSFMMAWWMRWGNLPDCGKSRWSHDFENLCFEGSIYGYKTAGIW